MVTLRALLGCPRTPVCLLGLLSVISAAGRCVRLGAPGEGPPGTGFIFDEAYYVNAARVIAHLPVPGADLYHDAAAGTDPNGEHPQMGKLLIAATMRLAGDNGVGWRLAPVILGTLALPALYWVVRAASGSQWLALAAAAVLAADPLAIVDGRVAVLDGLCLPFMLAGAALWLSHRRFLAGVSIGLGMTIKETAAYALLAILLIEGWRVAAGIRRWRRLPRWPGREVAAALGPALVVAASTTMVFATVLGIMDAAVPATWHGASVSAPLRPWTHVHFILDYAARLRLDATDVGPVAAASSPLGFWVDRGIIDYYVAPAQGLAFRAVINPATLLLALPALGMCAAAAARSGDRLAALCVAWAVATWLPVEVASLVADRTAYLYYMAMTMPAICIAVPRLLGRWRAPLGTPVRVGWAAALVGLATILYPVRP